MSEMNKYLSIILQCLLLCLTASAQTFQWVKQMGGTNSEQGYCIAVDDSGNVYSSGVFHGTADFDPGAATCYLTPFGGNYNIYISKLNAAGIFKWAKQIGGAGDSGPLSMTLDDSGNVYTTGYLYGTSDFDPGPAAYNLTPANFSDIFISKLNATGDFVWAKKMGGNNEDVSYSIALDDSGNVYTTGTFSGMVDFDPGPGTYYLTSNTAINIFITKLSAAGNFVWAKQLGGNGSYAYSNDIAVDDSGYIYIYHRTL
jgi:hypothetical protein